MFKLAKEIPNVAEPFISGLGIACKGANNTLLTTGKDLDTVEHQLNTPFVIVGAAGNELIVRTKEKVFTLDQNNTIKETYPFTLTGISQIKLFYGNDIMIIRNNVRENEWRVCKYDFRQSKVLWENDGSQTHLFSKQSGNYLIATSTERNYLIHCFNETDGTLLWQVNVNELGLPGGTNYHIAGQPKIYKDILLVGIQQEFDIYLAGLDIATGKLAWQVKGPGLRFHAGGDRILCYTGRDILQIDPLNGAILHTAAVQGAMEAAGIDTFGLVVFKDSEMYLAGIMDTVVSVWNIDNGELKWHKRLYEKDITGRRGITIPATESLFQVHDNRIYVVDSERLLHVFERIL